MLTTCYNHFKNNMQNANQTTNTRKKSRAVPLPPPDSDSLFDSKFDPTQFNGYYNNSFKDESRGC